MQCTPRQRKPRQLLRAVPLHVLTRQQPRPLPHRPPPPALRSGRCGSRVGLRATQQSPRKPHHCRRLEMISHPPRGCAAKARPRPRPESARHRLTTRRPRGARGARRPRGAGGPGGARTQGRPGWLDCDRLARGCLRRAARRLAWARVMRREHQLAQRRLAAPLPPHATTRRHGWWRSHRQRSDRRRARSPSRWKARGYTWRAPTPQAPP